MRTLRTFTLGAAWPLVLAAMFLPGCRKKEPTAAPKQEAAAPLEQAGDLRVDALHHADPVSSLLEDEGQIYRRITVDEILVGENLACVRTEGTGGPVLICRTIPPPTDTPPPPPTTPPPSSPPPPPPPTSGKVVLAFWLGWYWDWLPDVQTALAAIDTSTFTHWIFGRYGVAADGTIFEGGGTSHMLEKQAIAKVHAGGRKALIMLGGHQQGDEFDAATRTPELRRKLVQSIAAKVYELGYDGVDVDWEEFRLDPGDTEAQVRARQTQCLALLDELLLELPGKTLTFDGYWSTLNAKTVGEFMVEVSKRVDYVSVMTYAMAGNYPGWDGWHHSALDDASPSHPSSIKVSFDEYVAAGVPKSKLVIGIGAYGIYYTPECGVRAPRQRLEPVQGCVVQGDDNENYYGRMHREGVFVEPTGKKVWDAAASQTYITYNPPWPRYGNATRIAYVSYEDPQSIAAKGAFVAANGGAGAMVWAINYGWIDGKGTNPIMEAVRAAFLDGPPPSIPPTVPPPPPTTPPPSSPPPSNPPPSPPVGGRPTLHGYGAAATKGGYTDLPGLPHEEVKVTSLEDGGANSLRKCAVEKRGRPRVCDIVVPGRLVLKKALGTINVHDPYLTITAMNAPAPGVTIAKDDNCFNGIKYGGTHDVEVFGIRFEGSNWGWQKPDPNKPDICVDINNAGGFTIDGDSAPGVDIPWDPSPNPEPRGVWRCNIAFNTFTNGIDSNFDPYGEIHKCTMEANAFVDNWHHSSMTGKVAQGNPMPRSEISWIYNWGARNGERQPQFAHDINRVDVRYNVALGGWQPGGGGYVMRWKGSSGLPPATPMNVVGNAFLMNPVYTIQTEAGTKVIYGPSDPDRLCMWGDVPKYDAGPDERIKATALHYAGNLFPLGRKYPWNCVSTKTGVQPYPVPLEAQVPEVDLEQVVWKAGMPYPNPLEQRLKADTIAELRARKARQEVLDRAGIRP